MKILLANTNCLYGGVESHLAGLARRLRDRGHEPTVYFYNAGPALQAYAAVCDVCTGPDPTIGEVVVRGNYDLIHAQIGCFRLGLARAIALAGYRGPVVGSCHGWVPDGPVYVENPCLWTSVSQHARERLKEAAGMESVVIYNGVDRDNYTPAGSYEPSDKPIALWVGRTGDWSKDFPGFAAVASRLVDRDWRICVVDGARDDLNATLQQWLGDRTAYHRSLGPSEMARLYRSAAMSGGCLISTSASEAFGLAVLEAMACGCPAVAPRIGGIPEIVEDGTSGLLYDRSNACEHAVHLAEHLRGPAREGIIKEALARAEYFSEDRMVQQYERAYLDLADERTGNYDPIRRNVTAAALWVRRHTRAGPAPESFRGTTAKTTPCDRAFVSRREVEQHD